MPDVRRVEGSSLGRTFATVGTLAGGAVAGAAVGGGIGFVVAGPPGAAGGAVVGAITGAGAAFTAKKVVDFFLNLANIF